MITLKDQLVHFLMMNYPAWIHKGEIEKATWKSDKHGTAYLPSTVARVLQKAEEGRLIAVRPDKYKKSVEYKWIPRDGGLREKYIPTYFRVKGQETKLFKS